jgi:hypothetical protein
VCFRKPVLRDLNELTPIEKRRWYGVEGIGRAGERDLRNVQVVILQDTQIRKQKFEVRDLGKRTLKATFYSGSRTSSNAADWSP